MPGYDEVMGAIDRLMLAHTAEIRGGSTEELRAEVARARAEVAALVYEVTPRPMRPAEPEDDPRLPIRRGRGR